MRTILASAAFLIGATAAAGATDIVIYTGGAPTGDGSTYHNGMGVAVQEQLEKLAEPYGYEIRRVPSAGAVANAKACAEETENICFGIGQGGLTYEPVEEGSVQVIRNDLPGECAMAFTDERRLTNWKSVVDNAARVTFVVPKGSGSEAFIRKVFALEPDLDGMEPNFAYASGQQGIFNTIRKQRGAVGVFYAYPNPTEGTVNAAAEEGMTVMGILSPALARESEDYYLNRRAPYQLSWFGLGETKTVSAMCSKALLFAGDPDRLTDTWAKGDFEEFITELKALPADAFVPQDGPLARLMKEVEGLSEEYGVNQMVEDLQEQVSERM